MKATDWTRRAGVDAGLASERLAKLGQPAREPERATIVPSPLLAALRAAGTRHVYADTASTEELRGVSITPGAAEGTAVPRDVDGNTANQPLVKKVLDELLEEGGPVGPAAEILREAGRPPEEHLPVLYALLCARVGNALTLAFAAGRTWDTSLQLHMGLDRYEDAMRIGRYLHRLVPNGLVKVPFRPDRPWTLLVARDLERAGVPVNLTSTFSARQVAAAALVANASRTNVFMGRIEQGLEAELLGEHVVLEAQRALSALRNLDRRIETQLIVASMRDRRAFERVAGCDVFTAPCKVLTEFLQQQEVSPEDVRSRVEDSLDFRISERVEEKLGRDGVARLFRVEPAFVEFLRDLRASPGFDAMTDGDELFRRFDAAGFGDFFHSPTDAEREEARDEKLPKLDGKLVGTAALDAHYSLLANADFEKHQEEIDSKVRELL